MVATEPAKGAVFMPSKAYTEFAPATDFPGISD